jgi:hypothetical protein
VQDFPERNLLQRASRTSEEVLPRVPFLRRLFQWSSESREDYWNQAGAIFSMKNWFFPNTVNCDEIAPQKILLLEKSWAKAHMDGHCFLKVQ